MVHGVCSFVFWFFPEPRETKKQNTKNKKQYSESLGWNPPPSGESGNIVCFLCVFFDVFGSPL